MGWIEFQVEVMKRLMQKDESQWPMDDVWIVPAKGGRQVRLEARHHGHAPAADLYLALGDDAA